MLAFLDIHPIQTGHVLVVSKVQVDQFDELPDEVYEAVFDVVRKIAQRQKRIFGRQRACLRIEGFDVPHAHVHVYPCDNAQDFYGDKNRASKEPDHEALAKTAKKLAF